MGLEWYQLNLWINLAHGWIVSLIINPIDPVLDFSTRKRQHLVCKLDVRSDSFDFRSLPSVTLHL